MFSTIVQSAITLAAVALGWFLNERGRKSRERRLAIGRSLTTLLFFRRRMAGIKFLTRDIEKWIVNPPLPQYEVRLLIDRVTPRLVGWEKEYHEAVSYLAGEHPMLAMRLRTAALRANFILPTEWPQGANSPEAFSTVASHFIEPTTLDEPIRQLAKLHGRKVLRDVDKEMEQQDASDPEISELIERLIPFAGKSAEVPTTDNTDT